MQTPIAAFAQACEPYSFVGRWSALACDPRFVRFPHEKADTLLAELRERFTSEALINAGVAIADGADLRWLPLLKDAGDPLWIVALPNETEASAIVAGGRVIGAKRWLFDLLCEIESQGFSSVRAPNLIVTRSMIDLAILKSLGIDAIPSVALAAMGPLHVKHLFKVLRIVMPGYTPDLSELPPRLDFANWRIAEIDRSDAPDVMSVCTYLKDISTTLGLYLGDCGVWKPSEAHIDRIVAFLAYYGREEVRELLDTSLEADSEDINHTTRSAPSEVDKYMATMRKLRQGRRNSTNQASAEFDAEQNLNLNARERERVEPIVRLAYATSDPIARERLFALAQATQLSLLVEIDVYEQIEQTRQMAANGDPPRGGPVAMNPTAEFCRLEQLRLSNLKDLAKCTKPAPHAKDLLPREAPASFRPWALRARKSPP